MQREVGGAMEILVWVGSAVTIAGIAGLVWCIVTVLRARRAGLDGAAMQARLQRLVAFNLGAFAISALGLMIVVMGVILS